MILEIVQKHVDLKKQGAHYVGPCPKCGGSQATTRFVVNIAKDFCQCYSCGFNADAIRFLREIEGLSCPEAHRALGIECESSFCPAWDKCSHGRGDRPAAVKSALATAAAPSARTTAPYAATVATPPAELWQDKAAQLVERAHLALLDNPEQLAYLAGRGLPKEAVERYKLGYVPADFYRERASWGLPPSLKDDDTPKKLYIPQGIVIPWIVSGTIHRIRIRKQTLRNNKDARYYWLPGSGNDIICLNPTAPAHVVVESDLDGLLVDWLAGDLVGTVPLGSCSTHPKASALVSLEQSLRILVALDFDTPVWDENKQQWIAPGAKACGWWTQNFPRTFKRWPVPSGKDPGEAFTAGVDLRAWVVAGLPPALQEKAAPPKASPVNVAPDYTLEAPANPEPDCLRKTAQDGRVYYVTNDPATYRRLEGQKQIVFTTTELEHVVRAVDTPEQAAYFLTLKQVFPGTRITESTDLREPV